MLDERSNNYVLALKCQNGLTGIAFVGVGPAPRHQNAEVRARENPRLGSHHGNGFRGDPYVDDGQASRMASSGKQEMANLGVPF